MAEECIPQPNYFAVIPAPVMYDKRLKSSAKLLYAQITALTQKEGFCWATNQYFADLNNVDDKTISRLISQLVECGHLTIEVDKLEGNKRRVYLVIKSSLPSDKKVTTPSDEIVTNNNIYNNNISNIGITNVIPTESGQKDDDPRIVEGEKILKQYDESIPKLKQYGNGDVSYLIGYLKDKLNIPTLDESTEINRRYCWLAMRKFGGLDKVKMIIDAAVNDSFWSIHTTTFKTLYYKGVHIISASRDQGKWGVTKV